MPIKNRLSELHDEIIAWRRDLHENPELVYETHRTSARVAAKLREFGCDEVVEGIGRTGVVGLIKGRSDSAGRVVGLRADMDALPIIEATGLPYASKTAGQMHACGHDGHTAMLLGAAKYLSETRNFDGAVAVIFQPAEETGAGGLAMVEDGLIDRFGIKEVYGMHNSPGLPVGSFSIKPGAFYAATDNFIIDVVGKGGHAAKPHVSIDTTLVAAQIVVAFQSIASRTADPLKSVVVSVTSFHTEGDAFNVIPEHVELRGTVRSFDKELRKLAEERLKALATMTAAAYGARADVDWQPGYPAMVNSDLETGFAAEAAQRVSGKPVGDAPAIMAGEDFAYMLEACPGAYIQIGNGDSADLHHPRYNFNDEAIPLGASYWAELVESRMPIR
ncbi:MAG TPA: M20 aminoacylase family protein [Devosiaceae bacterium]|nr:M20 aminoacylase family protein [Devosiaceae bacterium]